MGRVASGLLFIFMALVLASSAQAAENPLPNPGFEEELKGWGTGGEALAVSEQAARSGKFGLRMDVQKFIPRGASIYSSALPVKPGQEVTVTYWARSKDKAFCGVYVVFRNAKNRKVKQPRKIKTVSTPGKSDGKWHEYKITLTAPEETKNVILWVHSWGGRKGLIDFDDFAIYGIDPGVKSIAPPKGRKSKALVVPKISELPKRKEPPVIILKLDDYKPVKGRLHNRWKKVDEYLAGKNIKYGAGVICSELASANEEFVKFAKDRQASGAVEFWFHAWDHGTHKSADGRKYSEFAGRGYDEQMKRVADSQKAAEEKFGFKFTTFGAPGGGSKHFDATTHKVMADEPNIKVWLYSKPIDDDGKKTNEGGKVTILDRVWEVNLESVVGVAHFDYFLAGYAKHPDRKYFILQGHPMGWDSARFNEFKKIVEFLQSQNAVFLTPTECAARVKSGK